MAGHKTARGREFNMSAFSQSNAKTAAIGNSSRNAAGDAVDARGNVLVSAKAIQHSYYKSPNAVRTVSIKEDSTIPPVIAKIDEKQASPKKQKEPDIESTREFTNDKGKKMKEVTYVDGSIALEEVL